MLYLITDRKMIADRYSLTGAVRKALKGGVTAVQLREKDLGTRDLLGLAYRMKAMTEEFGAQLYINDRFDIALAVGAEGVHLTQQSIPAAAVRSAVRRKLVIGVSTHSLKEAREAETGGADFVTFGPVYLTSSKIRYGPPAGVDALRTVCRRLRIPVYALGGVKRAALEELAGAGASGVAMISEIFGARNITKKAEELVRHSAALFRNGRA